MLCEFRVPAEENRTGGDWIWRVACWRGVAKASLGHTIGPFATLSVEATKCAMARVKRFCRRRQYVQIVDPKLYECKECGNNEFIRTHRNVDYTVTVRLDTANRLVLWDPETDSTDCNEGECSIEFVCASCAAPLAEAIETKTDGYDWQEAAA